MGNSGSPILNASVYGENTEDDTAVPDAIPLQYLGTIPTDLSKLSTEELFLYGLANADRKEGKEGGYAVRPGRVPVPDFGRTKPSADGSSTFVERNFSVFAFPFLYPYGEGGIEMERDVPVSLQDHIRANLHYWDRRFRTHSTWPFVFFGLLQKRQVLNAARTQTRRKDFDQAAKAWAALKQEDFNEAAEAEKKGRPITNPRILLLKRFITAAGVKVMGSDASRAAYRSQIWSTMLVKNPPSLWVTINPNDLHDPVVQVLAGQKIDMDDFVSTMGPDRQQRAENITKDPYASAQYFHYIINLVLEQLFGISVHGRKADTSMGILGRLSAYYGVVEAQGRGSLHVHMVLWLENAPSSDTMHNLLSDPSFRQRVAGYVDHTVRAHLDGLNAETIEALKKDAELGYSRPPCPGSANYDRDFAVRELHLVRAQQFHKCSTSTCLIEVPHTKEKVCKRRAPFPLAAETVVSKDGQISPKRTYGYLNNWNPFILVLLGCNNDIKFISNGFDARAIIWYITAYQTKKQQRSHNASALLADGIAYHLESSDYIDNIRQRNRLLISRCLRILNRQMEQSAPQVISYLLGYGDTFCSHSYVPLYWSSISAEISRAFPMLRVVKRLLANTQSQESDDEEVIIEMSPTGALTFRSQLTDYKLRGPEFENMSFVTFVVDTWEYDFSKNGRLSPTDSQSDEKTRAGKPRHPRAQYLPDHPRAKTHERVLRAHGHNTLPNIVGPYLPRNDVASTHDFYCASMLALLAPWRQITDLKPAGQSWSQIFDSFLRSAPTQDLDFISAAQYYYQCKEAVDHDRGQSTSMGAQFGIPENPDLDQHLDGEESLADENEFLIDEVIQPPRTETELDEWLMKQQNPREQQHGTQAVDIAQQAGLFAPNVTKHWPTEEPSPTQPHVKTCNRSKSGVML
ncbi:ATP-dependent DNA helicase pif1, putative [Rhizoctonia solani AG-3 Rhs1AP]|uniref:ATP-dependent DNA helicase pif1, putative n=1 Tax=Rhizoctonia solani AG-3 Rhs1AP TaxID=1086054 RepID=A0A0A1UHW7_9AGAM|nr:ATP-dependent DNA helicase pif1, putative [Rhizoctonia solani AG-3 Rhs1AP]